MVLKCDVCPTVYERPYSRHHLTEKVHRCSRACIYGSRSSDGIGGRGAEIIEERCITCGKPMKVLKNRSERKWGRSCSRKCYGEFRSNHPELYAASIAAMQSADRTEGMKARSERWASGESVHPRSGTVHNDVTKQLMREAKLANPPIGEMNGMFGCKHTSESITKMSEKASERVLNGTMKAYGTRNKKGNFTTKDGRSFFFRSSWEEAMMKHLDARDDVSSWDYESFRISYVYDNHKRWYVPDFTVKFIDGRSEVWEIKPKEFILSERNVLKTKAAEDWCSENESKYVIMTGDDLRSKGII